ncbi:type 1 fimbrial protein [Enterobacteriaceae bacterium H11S18]|uniref:fimbrial protein n=1 Tax=Enterobacteriaceae TaxID=543 RepID=UPI0019288C49|nr:MULTISPECIES: fimbrial protein [Enterobacteriaceae]MCT4706700.1 type 1 fimbrial protein [Dryocola clanedunensis]MCT4712227.1 type 1 fimbrial protein [Dryocola clanedunensis]
MKKVITSAALLAVIAAASMSAQAASTGTITFNGELTATTCDANVDGQGPDATIVLPTIGTNQLTAQGQTAGRTGFNIGLSNCAGTLQTASAFFEAGSSVDLPTGHLKNMTGDATNVSLQLRENGGSEQVIQAGNSNQTANASYFDISSGSADLPYNVEYFADAATTAGTVVSDVVYSIQYK